MSHGRRQPISGGDCDPVGRRPPFKLPPGRTAHGFPPGRTAHGFPPGRTAHSSVGNRADGRTAPG